MPEILEPPTTVTDTWLTRIQNDAKARFESLEWPTRTDERWRFSKLKRSDISGFQPAPAAADVKPLIDASAGLEKPTAQVVFCNHEMIHSSGLEQCGIHISTLDNADPDLVAKHLETLKGSLGSEKYIALQQSSEMSGLVVHAGPNAVVDGVIEIVRWVEGNAVSVFPLTLVIAQANSNIAILERIRSADSGAQLAIAGTLLDASDGAQVTYAHSQELTDDSKFVHELHSRTGKDAQIRALVANFGCGWVRQELSGRIDEQGANCELFGVNLAHDGQEIDQRTYQQHLAPNTRSDLLFKNALFDKARTIFSGLIHVYEEAHYTDAFQTCRNLLLSDDAEAHSMPGLEINADQVRCSHGATSGQIDEEELFYLRARGIRDEQARRIITQGFSADVICRLKNDGIEDLLERLVGKWLTK
ncbi:MAG: SufD family Fe-S cluster assembly protein [Verrucomicrobiota bacterium]